MSDTEQMTPSYGLLALFNVRAESLVLSIAEWEYALELALSQGWKPESTRKPPISFESSVEEPWDGRHSPACGQEVSSTDARQMGECLRRALAGKHLESFVELADYTEKGGFLICEAPAPVAAGLMRLASQLGANCLAETEHWQEQPAHPISAH